MVVLQVIKMVESGRIIRNIRRIYLTRKKVKDVSRILYINGRLY